MGVLGRSTDVTGAKEATVEWTGKIFSSFAEPKALTMSFAADMDQPARLYTYTRTDTQKGSATTKKGEKETIETVPRSFVQILFCLSRCGFFALNIG